MNQRLKIPAKLNWGMQEAIHLSDMFITLESQITEASYGKSYIKTSQKCFIMKSNRVGSS